MTHLKYLFLGLKDLVYICIILMAFFAALFGPAILASLFSYWFFLLYIIPVIVVCYLEGEQNSR